MKLSDLGLAGFGGWADDPLWASLYDWTVEHERAGRLLWRLGLGSDLGLLYDAAAEIGELPAGARVLDCPVGGGVALRGLRVGQGVDYVAADIAPTMLERTRRAAVRCGVADQVTGVPCDVGALPFADGRFDLVATFTGLHCFPDPRRAVTELVRVLRPGGVLTGSAVLTDIPLAYRPVLLGGRAAGLIGPSASGSDVRRWLAAEGMGSVTLRRSGAIGYFRAVKG